MKVTLTQKQVQESVDGVSALASIPLTAVAAYQVAKVIRQLRDCSVAFHDARTATLNRLGKPDEGKPGMFLIPDENQAEWMEEIRTLEVQEVEIEVTPLQLNKIPEGSKIEPRHLIGLAWLFEE